MQFLNAFILHKVGNFLKVNFRSEHNPNELFSSQSGEFVHPGSYHTVHFVDLKAWDKYECFYISYCCKDGSAFFMAGQSPRVQFKVIYWFTGPLLMALSFNKVKTRPMMSAFKILIEQSLYATHYFWKPLWFYGQFGKDNWPLD